MAATVAGFGPDETDAALDGGTGQLGGIIAVPGILLLGAGAFSGLWAATCSQSRWRREAASEYDRLKPRLQALRARCALVDLREGRTQKQFSLLMVLQMGLGGYFAGAVGFDPFTPLRAVAISASYAAAVVAVHGCAIGGASFQIAYQRGRLRADNLLERGEPTIERRGLRRPLLADEAAPVAEAVEDPAPSPAPVGIPAVASIAALALGATIWAIEIERLDREALDKNVWLIAPGPQAAVTLATVAFSASEVVSRYLEPRWAIYDRRVSGSPLGASLKLRKWEKLAAVAPYLCVLAAFALGFSPLWNERQTVGGLMMPIALLTVGGFLSSLLARRLALRVHHVAFATVPAS